MSYPHPPTPEIRNFPQLGWQNENALLAEARRALVSSSSAGHDASSNTHHALDAGIDLSVGLGPVHPAADIGLDERLMLGTLAPFMSFFCASTSATSPARSTVPHWRSSHWPRWWSQRLRQCCTRAMCCTGTRERNDLRGVVREIRTTHLSIVKGRSRGRQISVGKDGL